MTIQGVQLLYPFKKNACVLPANPAYRFSSNNANHEALLFAICVTGLIFLRPLIEQGFWTTYNQSFASVKHLKSEYLKSDDLLEVSMTLKGFGGVEGDATGYLMFVNSSEIVLHRDSLISYSLTDNDVIALDFRHSGLTAADLGY